MTTVIDTPGGLLFFNMLQVQMALRIQRDTGLTHSRGSVLKYAKRMYGVKGMRIKSAAEQMDALIEGAKAAQSVHNGATEVSCPYTKRNARQRELLEAFIRGADMIGIKLNEDGSL